MIKPEKLYSLTRKMKMSSECDKCGEHCLECKCNVTSIARIEKLENEVNELYKIIERLQNRFDEHVEYHCDN